MEAEPELLAEQLRTVTLAVYSYAAKVAREQGIIIADTKMEFGLLGEELILIDELLTPDSSRFWDAAVYEPGRTPARVRSAARSSSARPTRASW